MDKLAYYNRLKERNQPRIVPDVLARAGFHSKQMLAHQAMQNKRYVLFGGARGPGKSYWLRWVLLWFVMEAYRKYAVRGIRVMLGCEDYPTLVDRQLSKIEMEFPREWGEYRKGAREFRVLDRYGGGAICFRNMDDPEKYVGSEWAAIAIDELTKHLMRTFNILRGSLRWPRFPWTKFLAASNPNGVGAAWVRKLWIEDDFPKELKGIRNRFAFIPALPSDNPHLTQEYIEDLESQPEFLRRAWLLGDWYAGVEGLVYSNFNELNITEDEPDLTKPISVAYDDGYVDPLAILFVQRSGKGLLVFDELYESGRMDDEMVADVVERCEKRGWPLPEMAIGSVEANQLQKRFRRAGIRPRHKATKVVDGINLVRRLICDGKGYRAIKFHKRCVNTLWEVSSGFQYPTGKRGGHEKPMDGNDHCLVAGTLITTERGNVPIEMVTTADQVLTRKGYRRVLASGMTSEAARVITVRFSNGASLTGTPDHRVWVESKGYIELQALRYNDIMVPVTKYEGRLLCRGQKRSSIKALCFAAIPIRRIGRTVCIIARRAAMGKMDWEVCIEECGMIYTGQFQKDTQFTTLTETLSILTQIIWPAFRQKSTLHYMASQCLTNAVNSYASIWTESGRRLSSGIVHQRAERGIVLMANDLGKGESFTNDNVNSVMNRMRRVLRMVANGFVLMPARAQRVVQAAWIMSKDSAKIVGNNSFATNTQSSDFVRPLVWEGLVTQSYCQPVYDLTVEGAHEFFANGILVHNSMDALRYYCQMRMSRARKREEETSDSD